MLGGNVTLKISIWVKVSTLRIWSQEFIISLVNVLNGQLGQIVKYRKFTMIKNVTWTMLQWLNIIVYLCMTVLKKTFLVLPFYGLPVFPNPVWVQWRSPGRELGNIMDTSMSSALSGAGAMLAVAFQSLFGILCMYFHLWPSPFSQGRGESSPTATQHPWGCQSLPQWHSQSWTRIVWAMGTQLSPLRARAAPSPLGPSTAQFLPWQHLPVNMILLFPSTGSYPL